MLLLNILKALAVVGTTVLAIFATRYDYKKEGRVTKHGRIAIAVILLFGSFAIVAQFIQYNVERTAADNAKKEADIARERLQKENDRQTEILENTRSANSQIRTDIKKQEEISGSLTTFSEKLQSDAKRQYDLSQGLRASQEETKRLTDENFRRVIKLTDDNFARIDRLTNDNFAQMQSRVADFDRRVERNINRLSTPLRDVFVSYVLVYDRADERFPEYYKRMLESFRHLKSFNPRSSANAIVGDAVFPADEDETRELSYNTHEIKVMSRPRNLPVQPDLTDDLILHSYSWTISDEHAIADKIKRGSVVLSRHFGEPRPEITVDFSRKEITFRVTLAPVEIESRSNRVFSIIDITEPNPPLELFVQFQNLSHPGFNPPQLKRLIIHFDDGSRNVLDLRGELFKERYREPSGRDESVFLICSVTDKPASD